MNCSEQGKEHEMIKDFYFRPNSDQRFYISHCFKCGATKEALLEKENAELKKAVDHLVKANDNTALENNRLRAAVEKADEAFVRILQGLRNERK